jgi:hypothetical protein
MLNWSCTRSHRGCARPPAPGRNGNPWLCLVVTWLGCAWCGMAWLWHGVVAWLRCGMQGDGRNRFITVLFYLSDVEAGSLFTLFFLEPSLVRACIRSRMSHLKCESVCTNTHGRACAPTCMPAQREKERERESARARERERERARARERERDLKHTHTHTHTYTYKHRGETCFPMAGDPRPLQTYSSCDRGLLVPPKTGCSFVTPFPMLLSHLSSCS